jgi:nucleotide-binding universal stress UspA family protein
LLRGIHTEVAVFKTILVATDFSEVSANVLQCGREIARKFDASLHLVHVVADPAAGPWATEVYALPTTQLIVESQAQARSDLLEAVTGEERQSIAVAVPVGSAATEIVSYAKDHDVDLIVVGTHGRGGFAHLMLGSVAERVIRTAHCPVLVVRHPPSKQ